MTPAAPIQRNADAPAFWQVDILWLILATGETTQGQYCLFEQLCPTDSGPPPHTHTQREMFYILDGQITFMVGEEVFTAGAGTFVTVPPHTAHSFRVDSETARILNSYTPAGFERLILEAGTPAASRTLPPRNLPPRVDRETLERLVAAVGMSSFAAEDPLRKDR